MKASKVRVIKAWMPGCSRVDFIEFSRDGVNLICSKKCNVWNCKLKPKRIKVLVKE